MANDDDNLYRMVWNPLHFDNKTGTLKGAAFAGRDLLPKLDNNGHARYLSADLATEISRPSVDWRINHELSGEGFDKDKKITPRFVSLAYSALASQNDEQDQVLFAITHEPLAAGDDGEGSPRNDAHYGIHSTTPKPEDEADQGAKVQELRTALIACVNGILEYGAVFPDPVADQA